MKNQFKNCFLDWPIDKLLNIFLQASQFYENNITSGEVTTGYYLGSKLIAVRKGTTLSYVMQDHLGSTVGTLDASGNQVNTTVYSEFGSVSYAAGTLPTDIKFTGQRLDGTGLYYYGARYYDPAIGRFISPDAIVPDPYDPQSLNRYSYCLNNPLKYVDPTGHDPYIALVNILADQSNASINAIIYDANNYYGDFVRNFNKLRGEAQLDTMIQNSPVARTPPGLAEQVWASPNTLLGKILGETSGGTSKQGPQNTTIYEGVSPDSLAGWLLTDVFNMTAFTMGHVIFTTDQQITQDLQIHEMGHVEQYDNLGIYFLPLYGVLHLIYGYTNNPLEIDAR